MKVPTFVSLALYLRSFGRPWGADPREEAVGSSVRRSLSCHLGPPLGLQDPDTLPVRLGIFPRLCSPVEISPLPSFSQITKVSK